MKFNNYFCNMTIFEKILWFCSSVSVIFSFMFSSSKDILTLIASLIGVTALIFVAKGYVIGQVLTVVFSLFYGIISYHFHYYGEMITYLGMTTPIAVAAVISWAKHPYKESKVVEVHRLNKNQVVIMLILTVLTTVAFHFILKALGNANLFFSTVSITTSFLASYLTLFRSPFYALAYAANDIVLIILWIMATIKSPSYLPMIVCFSAFLANDLYGFINWNKMKKQQKESV